MLVQLKIRGIKEVVDLEDHISGTLCSVCGLGCCGGFKLIRTAKIITPIAFLNEKNERLQCLL